MPPASQQIQTRKLRLSPRAEGRHASRDRPPLKRALLIGVSSGDSPTEALRSSNDVAAIREVLTSVYGYEERHITILLESEGASRHLRPTKQNIIKQMRTLVAHARAGDHFFVFYAGHGLQLPCYSDSESDGQDEYMACEDGRWIKDNRLRRLLVDSMPVGAQLVALFDTCHSGTMLDLPHSSCNRVFTLSFVAVVVSRLHCAVIGVRARVGARTPLETPPVVPGDGPKVHSHIREPRPNLGRPPRCDGDCPMSPEPGAHVVLISSAADDEESWEDDRGGPLTRAFVKTVRSNPHLSYRALMMELRRRVAKTCYKRSIAMDKWMDENGKLVRPEDAEFYADLYERARRAQRPQLSSLQRLNLDSPLDI